MIFVKSVLAGIGVLFLTSIGYVFGIYYFLIRPKLPPGGMVGVDPRSLFGTPFYWAIALFAFAAGFYWKYHAALK